MRYYFQVLSSNTSLMPATGFLFFDNARYLFNCGDCVQRLANEQRIRLAKLKNIFITRLCPDTLGSLPGMILSLAEVNDSIIRKIHGPPGLLSYINSARIFTKSRNFEVIEYTDHDEKYEGFTATSARVFQDENIKMHVFPISTQMNESHQVMESGMAYIIECPPHPNKFLPLKAKALGIKPGKLFGKLSNGECVINDDGRVVRPEEVCEKGPPQPVVAIFDLPNAGYCKELLERLRSYPQDAFNIDLLVHFSKKEVILTPEYLEMVLAFPNAQNLLLQHQMTLNHSLFKKSDELLMQLNKILPTAFPLAMYPQNLDINTLQLLNETIPNIISPAHLTKVTIAPVASRGVDRTDEITPINLIEVLNGTAGALPYVKSKSCDYREIVDNSMPGSDPQITFLGTASMKPGSHRNVSCIHLSQWGGGLLLDCGEGSYSQLVRSFGDSITSVISDLKAVLITHLHADHHLGTLKILMEHRKYSNEPLIIVAPKKYKIYLDTCSKLMGPFNYTFQEVDQVNIPGLHVTAVSVDHSIEAYGFVITHNSGWKLVYSGDTRPCPKLIEAGYNATILIHEATLDDSLQESAVQKAHSTLSEALQVASAMEVWKVILTHFSQRYSKIPESTKVDAVYAFDLMKIKFSDCTELVSLMPTLIQEWQDDEPSEIAKA